MARGSFDNDDFDSWDIVLMVNTSLQSGDVVWLVDGEHVMENLQDVEEGQTQSTTLDVGQFSVLPLEEVGEGGYHLKTGLLTKSTSLVTSYLNKCFTSPKST